MKVNTHNIVSHFSSDNITCDMNGTVKIEYNSYFNKIYLLPCCGAIVKNYIEPIAWKPWYFITHLDECIHKYEELNLQNLQDYYDGNCVYKSGFTDDSFCKHYTLNKHIISIDNSIGNSCNINCKMCKLNHTYDKYQTQMYLDLLKALEDFELESVWLTSMGEPFLYKQESFEFIKNCKCNTIIAITNATLLNDEDILYLYKLSADYNKSIQIIVSIDSIKKDTFEKIRAGASFDKVINNIKLLKKYNLLKHINYVEQPMNINEDYKSFFSNMNIKINPIIMRWDADLKETYYRD